MKIGDTINNYKIIRFLKEKKETYTAYKVEVECQTCGHVKIIGRGSIKKQGCKQGPCHPNFIDLAGKEFGSLRVKEFIDTKNTYRRWRWKCRCSCGVKIIIPQSQIKNGQTACKKCTDARTARDRVLPMNMAAVNKVIKQYKKGALNRNLKFNLSIEEVSSLIYRNCTYCGIEPSQDANGLVRNGIDRIDSNKGYSIPNCVTCCKICNTAKSNLTLEEFYTWIKRVNLLLTKERSETIP